jgi:hypothetical protein
MGECLKAGLHGVVLVLLFQYKAKGAAVFNTNHLVSGKGREFADEL